MIDQTERILAQAITDAAYEAACRRGAGCPRSEIDAADIAWIDAQEAFVEAGYSLDALEALEAAR